MSEYKDGHGDYYLAEGKREEQAVVWEEMAEFRCPFCAQEDHWNHRADDGSCVSIDRIHDETCACSWRPATVIDSPVVKGGATDETSSR